MKRLVGLLFVSLVVGSHCFAADVPPNLIFVFCDNLGYGDIEPFGGTLHRTPHLNRMAAEGRRFTHFYATAGVCTPSRASLMTGCYSQRVSMNTNPRDGHVLRPVSPHGLHPDELTIAELLKEQGYVTSIIGKWHLGDQPVFLPTRQGFDSFFGIPYSDDMTHEVGQRLGDRLDGKHWPPLPLMQNEEVIEAPVDRDGLSKRYTERALDFIEQNQSRPFFLYMPQAMPGSTAKPFASAAFRGVSKNGPWGDSIEELDWSLGRILEKLVELKIDRRTLVIWTSDNGAPLARDIDSSVRGSNRPLHGRGYTTAEGAFRIPMIAWWPGQVPDGTACAELTSTLDMLPTFAKLAGAEIPADRIIDGHDVRDLLFDEPGAKTPCDAFYYYHTSQLQAVRSGPWKLFLPLKPLGRHPHFGSKESVVPLLFHVVDDIGSKNNVADDHPDIVTRLTALADRARLDLGSADRPGDNVRPRGEVSDPQPQTLTQRRPESRHPSNYRVTKSYAAVEAFQAATTDGKYLYAITSSKIAKYDRKTGFRLGVSSGEAQHLNSGIYRNGKVLAAHSNYPRVPEQSQVMQLDPQSMRLTIAHDFGDYGGSLTWVVRQDTHWLCNFARYGDDNHQTFLVRFDDEWTEVKRWKYPAEVIEKWGRFSTSGGIFRDGKLWITDHDHPRVDILKIPPMDDTLVYETSITVPFSGQGFAIDPVGGGLIGINRAKGQLIVAAPVDDSVSSSSQDVPVRAVPRDDQLLLPSSRGRADSPQAYASRRWQTLLDMQAVMGDFPGERKRCPLELKVIEEVDCGSYVRQSISYQSEPNGRVTAYLLVPKIATEDRRVPAVLCLHPTDNKIGHKVVVGLGGRANRQYASELAERGYVTLAPSYPMLAEYQPDVLKLGWESGTMKAIWDNVRGLDLLDGLPYVQHGKYAVIGHSLGGHNAVYTAVFDDRLVAIASSCGLDAYPDYFDGDLSRWLPGKGWTQLCYIPKLTEYHGRLAEIPFDFHEMISALAPRHVFIAAPLHDSNFRAGSVDRVIAAARPVFSLWNAEQRLRVEHPDCDHDFPITMRETAYGLFDTILNP